MAVPPVNETSEERIVRLAMERDLGIDRVENLPAEDGEKKGIRYSRAAADAVMAGPAVRAETNAVWLSAINAGDFDDDDAEGVKGLSTMAHGRLHAIRETTNSAPPPASLPSAAQSSSKGRASRKPVPYIPNNNTIKPPPGFENAHNSVKPPPGFENVRHSIKPPPGFENAGNNIASQKPKGPQNVPSPTNGAPRATATKAAPPGLTNKAGRHAPVQKKSQPNKGQRNTQPASSSPLRNSSSYQLGPTKPPTTSQLSNIVLDESVLCLQGETILYRDVAFLHQQAGKKPLPSSVLWLARRDVVEPMFIVVVDNAIMHEYPLSSWKTSWGTAPDRDIKFRDSLGIESTIRLTFINHNAVSLFVEKQDELAAELKTSSTMQDGSAKPNQTTRTHIPTTTESHPHTRAGTPTSLDPSGATKAVMTTNGTKAAAPSQSSSQNRAPSAALKSIPEFMGSRAASPAGANGANQPDAQSQASDFSTCVPGLAKASLSSSDMGGRLIQVDDDTTLAVRGSSGAPRSSAHPQEPHRLYPDFPSNSTLVLYNDQAHKTAAVDQAVTSDSVIALCQAITIQVEQLTQLHVRTSRKARDGVRQRLQAGLSKSFEGIEDPKRGLVISTLMVLFDAATSHNGRRYSADKMYDLRSDAEPPRGHDYEQARKEMRDLGVMNPLRRPKDPNLQVAQVAAKQTEDIPSLEIESQAEPTSASVDAESNVTSASFPAAAGVRMVAHSGHQITPVDTNAVKVDINDVVPFNVVPAQASSLRGRSSRSNSVSSQVTQGGTRRVGLASSRWASGAAPPNIPISASPISSSPIANTSAIDCLPSVTSVRPASGSNSLMFSSRFAECIPRTSALFDLSSLEGGGVLLQMNTKPRNRAP
ncbi:hypothetical protein MCOR25_004419 [Pyricularia grisea]|nr:hypothetical protein MCOR25_004419 [Pyricularia grisea]